MEKRNLESEFLFKNYLRELYVEIDPADIKELRELVAKTENLKSWCMICESLKKTKKILSYYLVKNRCPEYKTINTIEVVEDRLSSETGNVIKQLVMYPNILIVRHSSNFIKNRLIHESLMNIVVERAYRDYPTIVVSDKRKDYIEQGHTYYDHDAILKYIPNDITSSERSIKTSSVPLEEKIKSPVGAKLKTSSRTKSSTIKQKTNFQKTKEAEILEREEAIKKESENAV